MLRTYLFVALGSALGGVTRHWLSSMVARAFGETFPYGTLLINISGSFAIALFFTLTGTNGRWMVSPNGRIFFMVGICGGYTTFSSFSLATINLIRAGQWLHAGLNVAGSVVLCLLAALAGHLLAARFNSL